MPNAFPWRECFHIWDGHVITQGCAKEEQVRDFDDKSFLQSFQNHSRRRGCVVRKGGNELQAFSDETDFPHSTGGRKWISPG